MSYNPAPGDLLEVRAVCRNNVVPSQISENVTHWTVTSTTGSGATQLEIAIVLDTAWFGFYKVFINNVASYRGTSVQRCQPLPRVIAEFTTANATNGTGGANPVPDQVCGLLKLGTNNTFM